MKERSKKIIKIRLEVNEINYQLLETPYSTLPECKGWWKENNSVYIVEPWGIPGVFEYSYYRSSCDSAESKSSVFKRGTSYYERNKKES